jgi:hypothetical protein
MTHSKPSDKPSPLNRRHALVGVGAVGALAAVAGRVSAPAEAVPAEATKLAVATEGGYQLSEHVQRYYQTARV